MFTSGFYYFAKLHIFPKNSAFFPSKPKIQEFSPYSTPIFPYIFAPMNCASASGLRRLASRSSEVS